VTKLNVIVALAKGVKSRVNGAVTALHRESQKVDLYAGLSRTYRSKDENGDQLPAESVLQRLSANDVLTELTRLLTEAWDVEATLARSNCEARAAIVVGDQAITEELPTTFLIYLEKQLTDVYTFIGKLPTLDPTETWAWDDARGCYVTAPSQTTRTKKVPRSTVLYEATKEHPAQVQVYNEDVVEGFWTLIKFSGALPVERKREILLRVVALRDAVKAARERANLTEVIDLRPAAAILEYVLRS
jgi:hypothetical protein